MKPSPDDDHQIEPPKTRAQTYADVDESAQPKASQADRTEDDVTKKMAKSEGISSFGMGSGPASTPASTGGTPPRGVSGKIEPNQTLYSKYHVVKKLGGGAMGDVWLVRHASMGDLHALKLIVSNIASNEVALKRFKREFKVMASLKHPHAVQIFDAAIDDDGGYIDMEYVQGQTLHDLIVAARKRPDLDPSQPLMTLSWVVRVLDQLTDVLQEAHDKGIVHRDLKPGNLMLLDGKKPGKESLKVLDFGIAKIRDDPDNAANQTLTQGFIGTPSYGSPEQAMSRQDIDGRADVYSVGVMLYEFVTGRLPFKGVHFQVMHQHATMPPPPFHEANPKLRPLPELERVILRALSKDRDHRQQTARDLYDAIAQAVEEIQGPIPGTPQSTWNPPIKIPSPTVTPVTEPGTEHDGGVILVSGGPDTLSTPTTEPVEPKPEEKRTSPDKGGGAPSRWRRRLVIGMAALLLAFAAAGMAAYAFRRFGDKVPAGYKATAGTRSIRGFPEKLFRESDRVTFTLWSDGIYLPDGYSAVDRKDFVDGWPRRIKRDGVDNAPLFVRIPGNKTWMMGAWDAIADSDRMDAPAHPVVLTSGFYMQEKEVTNGEMEEYFNLAQTGYAYEWRSEYDSKKNVDEKTARDHPAVSISHKTATDCARFVRAMLPTEAQWEYAARSMGEENHYAWGSKPDAIETMANVKSYKEVATVPVGTYTKDVTLQGLMDMTGNVKEMCRDVWERYPKSSEIARDPCVTSSEGDTNGPPEFVIRGGDYASFPEGCTTTYRDDKRPDRDKGYPGVGFRMVIECPDARPARPAR